MIKEMGKESTLGEVVATMWETLLKTFATDLDRCTGMPTHTTKESGFRGNKMDRDKFGRAAK